MIYVPIVHCGGFFLAHSAAHSIYLRVVLVCFRNDGILKAWVRPKMQGRVGECIMPK